MHSGSLISLCQHVGRAPYHLPPDAVAATHPAEVVSRLPREHSGRHLSHFLADHNTLQALCYPFAQFGNGERPIAMTSPFTPKSTNFSARRLAPRVPNRAKQPNSRPNEWRRHSQPQDDRKTNDVFSTIPASRSRIMSPRLMSVWQARRKCFSVTCPNHSVIRSSCISPKVILL